MAAQGASSSMSSWHVSLFMIWLGAVVCQLGLMAYGWLLVESWLAQAHDVTNPRIGQLLESARRRVGLKRTVRLRDSGQCTTPLVVGWIRPVILLPTAVLESLKPAELEAVLVHELTHLARGDGWWRVLQSILRTFYFFHPAVWLAGRALARTCEEACDELTVKALAGQRREYAEAIFKAAALVGYHGPHLALNMLGDVMPVKARLSRILDPRLPQSSGGSWRHALIVILLAIVLLPTGVRRTQAIPPASAILSDWQHSAEASPPATVSDQAANNQAANSQAANNPAIENPAMDTQAVDRSSQAQQGEIEQALQSAPPRSDLERQALELLKSEHFEQRLEGYATLAKIGTIHSLADLESAFLTRSGIEQDAAERALKHVWTTIRNQPAESNTSARIYSEAPRRIYMNFPKAVWLRVSVASCVLWLLTLPVTAQELRYRWQPNQKFSYNVTVTVDEDDKTTTYAGTIHYEVNSAHVEQSTLTYRGGLHETAIPKPNRQPSGGFGPPGFGGPFGPRFGGPMGPFSRPTFAGKVQTTNRITLTGTGRVLAMEGESHLPFLLGNVSLMPFEILPKDNQRDWLVDTGCLSPRRKRIAAGLVLVRLVRALATTPTRVFKPPVRFLATPSSKIMATWYRSRNRIN